MKKYQRVQPEVIVGIGDETKFLEHQPPFQTVLKLHIDLDDWLGDDLMECHPCYIVTEQLKNSLLKTNFTGFEFDDVKLTKGEYFKDNYHLKKPLPKFFWMKIIGKESKDNFYISLENYLMCDSEALEFISNSFTHKYLDIALEQDPEQKALLEKLLERAKQRNSNSK